MSTKSVSKGVFAFKRSKRQKADLETLNYWRNTETSLENRKITLNNYRVVDEYISNILQGIQSEVHSRVFEDLVQFVSKTRDLRFDNECKGDIPTACLVTGVNMPDHDAIFANLVRFITDVTPYVTRLNSKDCPTVKSAIYKMTSTLMGVDDVCESDDETSNSKSGLKRAQFNIPVFSAWYKEKQCKSPRKGKSPSKKQKTSHENPIVVILEDIESFQQNVLQDIILIASDYRSQLPFVFLFGVSTTPAALHSCVNQTASSVLAIETFQAEPSSLYLNQVIDKVLLSPNVPFHVGGKVFNLLVDVFLYNDLSVKNFISAFKYCMLTHYSTSSGASMCCLPKDRGSVISELDSKDLDNIRKLTSFRSYIEKQPAAERPNYILDDKFCREKIIMLMFELDIYYEHFVWMVKVLHSLTSKIPHAPMGKQVREVLYMSLAKEVIKTEPFEEAWNHLKKASKSEILSCLQQAKDVLKDSVKVKFVSKIFKKLEEFIYKLENFDQIEESVEEENQEEEKEEIKIEASDRFHLKEKLLKLSKSKEKCKNRYEVLRNEILDYFLELFTVELKPPFTKPLHEILFFDTVLFVKNNIVGKPRASITTALSNPEYYLLCKCCKLPDSSSILSSLPDLSVAYKLHLECGRLINLYDWLQAFIAIVDPDESDAIMNSKGKPNIDSKLQARFIQAVSELQFLGFIKPTKRKTDHVARLTWGGC